MIEKVIYQQRHDVHENPQRVITTIINGDIENFIVDQVRLCSFSKHTETPGHWREYPELCGIIGKAKIMLEDIESKERREYDMNTGDRLFIPERVAVKVQAYLGTIIVTCSPKADRESGTHKYQID